MALPDDPFEQVVGGGIGGGLNATVSHPPIAMVLAQPLAIPLDAQQVESDPTLRAFIAQESADFYLVHLACSFEASWIRPVRSATMAVTLAEPTAPSPPVAWSMMPLSEWDEVEASSGVKLGVDLKLASASLETSRKATRKRAALLAYGELTSEPWWQIIRRRSRPVLGSQRFIIVIRAARGGNPQLTVQLSYRAFRQTDHDKQPLSTTTYLRIETHGASPPA